MRLLDYIKREGLRATAAKVSDRIDARRGGRAAETVFLCRENHGLPMLAVPENFRIRPIEEPDLPEYEKFKFFPHIDPHAYVSGEKDGAIGCFDGSKLVGYVCYEREKRKSICGTGDFVLAKGEAWVGPCYVDRAYRGKGLNRTLVAKAADGLESKGITRLFTSINGANASSLASFKKMGFREFARYSSRNGIRSIPGSSSAAIEGSALKKKIVVNDPGKDIDNG